MMQTSCRCPLAMLLAMLLVGGGCAGYQLGSQSLYPDHIQTVHVPVFESASFRRNMGERLTEAVCKEIERNTPYKVVGRTGADSVLSGRITNEMKRVVVEARSGEAREIQTSLYVEASWTDCRGDEIHRGQAIALPPEIAEVSGSGNLIPEVGQSIATAQQKAITRVAEQIVSLMERPW
ncbi:MAG: hypothetical protein HQ567_16315 [Candidatus Nealsonbacteria bacterium]|nr:hypothetical protein [Candidatus Nealsonbacteria bacterium]